jgi:fructokinase
MTAPVLCVGEVLWDALPAGLFLGGSCANVAQHLAALDLPVQLASAVGDDALGREARRRLIANGVDTTLLQVDASHPTGWVSVRIDAAGNATYQIDAPAAWDRIVLSAALEGAARAASALVFCTLTQRSPISRSTIEQLWSAGVPTVLDVNLRPPHDTPAIVDASLQHATAVKLNDQELDVLRRWFDLPLAADAALRAIAERFGATLVCLTRGADGAALWHRGQWSEVPGVPVRVRDTVGAGDAFLARLLAGWLAGEGDAAMLDAANQLAAFVATQDGAVPPHPPTLRPRSVSP